MVNGNNLEIRMGERKIDQTNLFVSWAYCTSLLSIKTKGVLSQFPDESELVHIIVVLYIFEAGLGESRHC